MNIDLIISKIIEIPSDFYKLKNISFYELLKNSGYFECPDKIDEQNIKHSLLNSNIEIFNKWKIWSENKRTNSGWHFIEKSNKYLVGYLSNGEKTKELEYSDRVSAYAFFIKYEIEEVRLNK
jgi:hypothetical protein